MTKVHYALFDDDIIVLFDRRSVVREYLLMRKGNVISIGVVEISQSLITGQNLMVCYSATHPDIIDRKATDVLKRFLSV